MRVLAMVQASSRPTQRAATVLEVKAVVVFKLENAGLLSDGTTEGLLVTQHRIENS